MPSPSIRFYLNDQLIQLNHNHPQTSATQTLLRFIRETKKLTGTKEGCAEGDCGACTVVVADLDDQQQLRVNSVNSCLLLLGLLDQKAIFTIEYLQQQGQLHPIQQAFVEQNASQCGFCTSGFIMSVYGQYQKADCQQSTDTEQIKDLLAGNLCRCTGYGSIIKATQQVCRQSHPDLSAWQETQRQQLLTLQQTSSTAIITEDSVFFAPKTTDELCQLLQDYPQAKLIAGGTDLGLTVSKKHQPLKQLIAIKQISELQQITLNKDHLSIGSAVTYTQFMETIHSLNPKLSDYLHDYLLRHSSTQIRNQATLIGNIANASPVGDLAPVFIALGCQLILASVRGERQIRLADYFIAYQQQDRQQGEYIKAIQIPLIILSGAAFFGAYKVSKRQQQDITTVSAGFYARVDNHIITEFRSGFAGLHEIPKSLQTLDNFLIGKQWQEDNILKAQEIIAMGFKPHSGHRGSAEYRTLVAKNLLLKFFLENQ